MMRFTGPLSSATIRSGGNAQDVILFKGKDPGLPREHPFTRSLLAKGWLVEEGVLSGLLVTDNVSTGTDASHIYILNQGVFPAKVRFWGGQGSDSHWVDVPHTDGNTTGAPTLVATGSAVYLSGLSPVDNLFTIWRRAVDAAPEAGWEVIALPADLDLKAYGMTPMVVDHSDTLHLLAENNQSYAHWVKPAGGAWTAKNVLYSGGEGSASPQARLVWGGPCRTGLVCIDSYRKYLKIFDPRSGWLDIGILPGNVSESAPLGVFLRNGREPWCFGEAGQMEGLPPYAKVWTPQSSTGLPDGGTQTDWGGGIPLGLPDATALFSGNAISLSGVETLLILRSPYTCEQPSYWGVVFDGSTFRTSELQLMPPRNGDGDVSLYYQGNPATSLPVNWTGDLALGSGEQLLDGTILCFSPRTPS